MRTSKVLALLSDVRREHERERAAWDDERQRLLDRIMVLAEKPMYDPGPARDPIPDAFEDFASGDEFDDLLILRPSER